ncbi:Replication initiation and membrane attachment protein [Bacillus sp. FJAT-27231]|uniref:replication initiation and membrane attachment family protein n=1 Tax=Bacillus sp. FJAT-27231 TaxID=1679168 RepID=UPI0006716288|nr:replication initiation and membrane attachment family protein [Bacillus sp. FJAT-27231]KMY56237.1 Replication initiation and membrane attachment protein [Bacillus sp. FJAT-27231]
MKRHWNEIQPVDEYIVCLNGMLHETDRRILTFLYQPLLGTNCFSLYMTLWAEVEENRLRSQTANHYYLMNFLDQNLQEIYESRLKLEALGLLKTFVRKTGDLREFVYELQPPLTPEQFFNDGMLNVFLYRKIGRSHFLRVKEFFSDDITCTDDHLEITKDFQEVFSAGLPPLDRDVMEDSLLSEGKLFMAKPDRKGVSLKVDQFDFSLLESSLQGVVVAKSALTPLVKETIVKLAHLYGIEPLEMKNLLLTAVDEKDEIDIEVLRKSARDWYQLERNEQLPELIYLSQPEALRTVQSEPSTKEEELIYYLETVSPRQLLIDISGSLPSSADMQVIEGVLFQYKLPAGVVNVLIQYVMLKTDMKLTKSYIEKIASHWARKKVKTVKDAMELAKNEHRQYAEWAKNKQQPKQRVTRTEKLPYWFNEEEKATSLPPDDEEKLKAMREALVEEIKNQTAEKEGDKS